VVRLHLLDQLQHGDRRSIGRADHVVRAVLKQPAHLPELVTGLWHRDLLVRMRAGDALEKVGRIRPSWIRPFRAELLALAAATHEQELRWHLAQLLPRLGLRPRERHALVVMLRRYRKDPSVIVRVSALQALADLAQVQPQLRRLLSRELRRALETGSPAERARARKLLAASAA
jgi:hypothetical protein